MSVLKATDYEYIRGLRTTYEDKERGASQESLLRAYHIVQKVKFLCARNTAPDVVLELIEFMERP